MPVRAAETGSVRRVTGSCYKLYRGQGLECLQQTLKELGIFFEKNGCLAPNVPGTNVPETNPPGSNFPENTDAPETNPPESNLPGNTDAPGTNPPESNLPENTGIPETSRPGSSVPETNPPADNRPAVSQPPVAETTSAPKPDAGTSDSAVLSYAEQVVRLVNTERAKAGLPALELQKDITAAANVRAKEIKQSFSHTRPNGSSFSSALKEQGITYRGSGENIAWGQKSPEQVMAGWMNSDGHRANILNKNFKNIGVGYYQDERGVNYWVQLFTY